LIGFIGAILSIFESIKVKLPQIKEMYPILKALILQFWNTKSYFYNKHTNSNTSYDMLICDTSCHTTQEIDKKLFVAKRMKETTANQTTAN